MWRSKTVGLTLLPMLVSGGPAAAENLSVVEREVARQVLGQAQEPDKDDEDRDRDKCKDGQPCEPERGGFGHFFWSGGGG
jgi:hypothetical protein